MSTNFSEYLKTLNLREGDRLEDVASFRPTFYIGLGGFGCTVVRRLKERIRTNFPEHLDGFAFLGLDTHQLPPNDVLTRNEYVPLSLRVSPRAVAPQFPEQLGWFADLCGAFMPRNIAGGADRVRAVGRLAFRNPPVFGEFIAKLQQAANRLREPRQNFTAGVPTKVYVISTVAGGTGSGCLLDVLASTGEFFRTYEAADFPYQAILATPDVLLGEVNPGELQELYGNSYATLKELHYFISGASHQVENYDGDSQSAVEVGLKNLPQMVHFIGDKNEAGSAVVTEMTELGEIAVSYLLSEIQTPMAIADGKPKVQDLENIFLGNLGLDDMPRCFSSFGVVRTGIPADVVGHYFSLRLAFATLTTEIADSPTSVEDATRWVTSHKLAEAGTDQFQDSFKEPITDEMKVAVDSVSALMRKGTKLDDLAMRASSFVEEMRTEVDAAKKPTLEKRAALIEAELLQAVNTSIAQLVEDATLGQVVAFAESLMVALKSHQTALSDEAAAKKAELKDNHEKELKLSIQGVQAAAQSGFFGRRERVKSTLSDLGLRLEALLEASIDLLIKQHCLKIYSTVLRELDRLLKQWKPPVEVLRTNRQMVEQILQATGLHLDKMADVQKRESGNRFSLIDHPKAQLLYEELLQPGETGIIRRVRNSWLTAGRLEDTKSRRDKWVEDAIKEIRDEDVANVLSGLTFNRILDRFYSNDSDRSLLFRDLQTLSSPMFWLDQNKRESHYTNYWILAIHPGQKDDFSSNCSQFLPGDGLVYAFFESPHEVVLYQLKMGYTIHSHRSLSLYSAVYNRVQRQYQEGIAKKKNVRPIHAWPHADEWDDPLPHKEEEEALRWFALGRAFSVLFPAEPTVGKGKKKGAFLYASGANYYLVLNETDRPIALGNGLAEAIEKLTTRSDWYGALREKIDMKVSEVGIQGIRERLESEYLPVLQEEVDTSEGNRDSARAALLRRLQKALKNHINRELTTARV